jgi:YD repeat-containing protein
VLLGNGTGSFAGRTDYAVGDRPIFVALGDLDGDGDLDFAAANNGGTLSIRVNNTIAQVISGPGRRFTYDPVFNKTTSVTDELGRQTLYEIDPVNGNLLSTTRVVVAVGGPDDVITRYTYTPQGLIDTQTDPLGRVTDYLTGPTAGCIFFVST